MGEAKHKRERATAEAGILEKIDAHAIGARTPSDLQFVRLLIVRLSDADAAIEALGGLPSKCRDYLEEARKESITEDRAIVWEFWPSGRQAVHMALIPKSDEVDFLDLMCLNALGRGFDLQLTAFPAADWEVPVGNLRDTNPLRVRSLSTQLRTAKPLHIERRQGVTAIFIPKHEDEVSSQVVLAQILRLMDEWVATKDAVLENHGTVSFAFDGYDDDPREVWDIPECSAVLKAIDNCAPWWPWLIRPEQGFLFTGSLLSKGPTTVAANMGVSFPVDDGEANEFIQRCILQCTQALGAAGIDPKSASVQQQIIGSVVEIYHVVQVIKERNEQLKQGVVAPATPEEIRTFHESYEEPQEVVAEVSPRVIVIDRSIAGDEMFDGIRQGRRQGRHSLKRPSRRFLSGKHL